MASPPLPDHISPTASDLYEHEIANWSEQQGDLPRRLARGEQVHGVGWENVAEEIECVGRNEVKAVELLRGVALLRVLKLLHWPEYRAGLTWRGEVANLLPRACRRYEPSIARRLDIGEDHAQRAALCGQAPRCPGSKKATVSAVEVISIEYLLSANTGVDESMALFEPR